MLMQIFNICALQHVGHGLVPAWEGLLLICGETSTAMKNKLLETSRTCCQSNFMSVKFYS